LKEQSSKRRGVLRSISNERKKEKEELILSGGGNLNGTRSVTPKRSHSSGELVRKTKKSDRSLVNSVERKKAKDREKGKDDSMEKGRKEVLRKVNDNRNVEPVKKNINNRLDVLEKM